MTKYQSLHEDYRKALLRLEEALDAEKSEMSRDSAVLRFIMTFEAAWKLLQVKLKEEHAVDCTSPKSCIREAFHQGILPNDPHWLEIANKRNRLTHIYSEMEAEEIYQELPEIVETLRALRAESDVDS